MWKRITKILRAVTHCTFVSFILVLPLGYCPDCDDSTGVIFGLHAGTGQTASVIRDCSGDALHSVQSPFKEISGSIYVPIGKSPRSKWIGGLRAGYWTSDMSFATSTSTGYPDYDRVYGATQAMNLNYSYFNPNISLVAEKIGFGFGYVHTDMPVSLDDLERESNLTNITKVRASGHLRLGYVNRTHFVFSFAENEPLIAGGGLGNIGLGYAVGSGRGYTGITGGFYETAGFHQEFRFRLDKQLYGDFSFRAGGQSEVAVGFGLHYRINLK